MKIFLSWSGDRSKSMAETLKKWLPFFIQAVKPWMSAADIDKGTRWSTDIASHLEECKIGILCLTPENIEAPWILFEAGALSKTIDKAFVCPLLFEVDPSELKGPLVQFQSTRFLEDDFKKLIYTINKCVENNIPETQIEKSFEAWWPQMESELKELSMSKKELLPKRKDREILEEILALVRQQARDDFMPRLKKEIFLELLRGPENEVQKEISDKIRVYELAEIMGIDNKDLIARLRDIGVDVKSHTTIVDADDANKLLRNEGRIKPTLIRRKPRIEL